MRRSPISTTAFGILFALILASGPAGADPLVLYGGNGGHNDGTSINDGALVIIDQTAAMVSLVGHPDEVARLTGLAFNPAGTLWGTTLNPGFPAPPPPQPTTSSLIRIDPVTGALLSTVPISLGSTALSIADLAVQPGTGTLYAVTGPNGPGPARLFTLNTTTGVATPVGTGGGILDASFASIAFSPSGALYASLASFAGGPSNPRLVTINPATAAILTSISTADFFGAFGIRPTDGLIFGGTGDEHQLFTVNAATGAETLIGDTGANYVGDLDFQPVPEPATYSLLSLGLGGLIARWRKSRSGKHPI